MQFFKLGINEDCTCFPYLWFYIMPWETKIMLDKNSPSMANVLISLNWNRISPAQLCFDDSYYCKTENSKLLKQVPSLAPLDCWLQCLNTHPWLWLRSGDPGGRTTQPALTNCNHKLKRYFSFRRVKNPIWFSVKLRILSGELNSALSQSQTLFAILTPPPLLSLLSAGPLGRSYPRCYHCSTWYHHYSACAGARNSWTFK